MPKLLVTGGSGYLGGALLRRAPALGWEVVATYCAHPPAAPGATAVALDLRDPDAAARLLAELRPAAVIHTAFRQDGPDLHAVTAEGAGRVASAARAAGARLLHMSSDVIFDGERRGAYVEDDPPTPVSAYGAAKAEAERLVADAHPGALVVRTSLIYGGPQISRHEQVALDAAAGRADITFFTDELRCPVQVDDLAAALLELLSLDLAGPLHVAGADTVSRFEFARLIAEAHGGDVAAVRGGPSPADGPRRPRNCALDCSRARAHLRTRLRGVHEVLAGGAAA